jgi:hypothetical protein
MAENSQQQGRSPSQIAAAARGGHDGGQHHDSRSPSAIAAAARGGVHGPEAGQDRGIQGGDVQGNGVQLGRSPSQIAAEALSGVVNSIDANQAGHTLSHDGGGPDGKGWVDWIEKQREKNQQGGNGEGQNQRGRGRSLPEEQRQRQKEQEQDKGPSPMDRAREWVHEHGFDLCY